LKRRAIIHISIIELYLSAELKDNPALEGAPFIIGGEGKEIKKGAIIAASAEARALGLRPGMAMRKALKARPEVTAVLPRYEAVNALTESFFELLRGSTQMVESFGPDTAFISVSLRGESPEGDDAVYLMAAKIAADLQGQLLQDLGLHTAIGIAHNKPIARLAGHRAEKDGIKTITKNNASTFIKTLPISCLPAMDNEAAQLLKNLNMGTVDELSKTPLLFFEKNFGAVRGKIIFESARCKGPEKVRPFFEAGTVSDEVTFNEGGEEASIVKETLYILTEELTLRLKAARSACRTISIKLTLSNFKCFIRTLELEEETDSFTSTWAGASRLLEDIHLREKPLLIGLKLHSK